MEEVWKEYKLGDVLCQKGYIRGPFGSALKRGDLLKEGIPVYEQQHAIYNRREFRYYISEEKYNEMKRFSICPDDIIISCSGTVGEVSLIKKEDPLGIISQALLLLRVDTKKILPEYLLYFFKTAKGHNSIISRSSGSVQVNIARREVIESIPLLLPSICIQKSIVTVLRTTDDKIECNHQINDNFPLSLFLLTCFILWLLKLRNDNLQQQAQALYKSWFVDFDPFKDGQFEDSELGLIPLGWSVKQLGEITTQVNERVKERVDVKVLSPITTGELVLSEEYFTKQVFSESISKYIVVKPSDFAYNPARVNIGSLGMNEYEFDGCVSPVYVVFRCENGYQYYFDLFRHTETFKEEVRARAIGGVRQSLAYKDFSLIKVVYPPIDVIHSFNQVYSRILAKTKHSNVETSRLASLRDTLLPKLMSGELKISELNL